MSNKISGYFLSFDDSDLAEVERNLSDLGYEVSPAGLKDYIMDSMDEEPDRKEKTRQKDEGLAIQIRKFLKDNPDVAGLYANLGVNALKSAVDMIADKIKKARAI